MTYVSHPVRAIRDDPVAGESVVLLLRVADDAPLDEVAAAVRELGGTVEAELEFETLAVAVEQAAVADVCELDGLDAVETENTLAMDLDGAGEDVEY